MMKEPVERDIMGRSRWHIDRQAGVLTVARRLPVRFDLQVRRVLPMADAGRMARQVRQDVWRALRGLRGFSPAVRVAPEAGGLAVIAGGQVDGALPRAVAEARIAAMLDDPDNRARWARWAGRGRGRGPA